MSDTSKSVNRCGFVAIVGRPNVGKSTLLNHMLGQKVSITSRKPQTTRNNVQGIKTEGGNQIIFVDTPGLHLGQSKAINRYMNRSASTAIKDVDLVIFMVARLVWTDVDEMVAQQVQRVNCPVVVASKQVDQLDNKDELMQLLTVTA